MGVIRSCFIGFAFAACTAFLPCAFAESLPAPAARVLTGHSISPDDVSVVIHALDDAEPVLAHAPDASRNPASVMKLVTTWAALELLGPAYTWPTEVYLDGELERGKLDGDLVLKGYGDPFLVLEEFWKMLRALRRLGLEEIDGDLVIDDSHFAVDDPPPGEFDGQPHRTYNVVPSALLVNFKAVSFHFFADAGEDKVRVVPEPPLANLKIVNQIRFADGPCRGYQAGISFAVGGNGLDEVRLGGAFPRRCGSYSLSRTVLEHDTYVYGLFSALWEELGGRFDGKLRKATVASDAVPVLKWRSPPLADVVRSINKNSNNVMTRQLVYTLGAETAGPPGIRAHGIAAIRNLLESHGLDTSSLVIDNGSGLSRDERISARLLVDMLRRAAASPYAAEFVSSLSLGGLDGTTRRRFNGNSAVMHVKTGRLDHVSALAGYLRAASGKDYALAIIVNARDAHRGPGQEFEEAFVKWAYETL